MKKKIFGILVCMLLIAVPFLSAKENIDLDLVGVDKNKSKIISQPPIQWQKDYGYPEAGASFFVQQTSDGGYISTGVLSITGGTNHEAYLVKTDANGNLLWSQTYDGDTVFDCGYCVQQTTDGGYIIAGSYHGHSLWLIKTDSNGNKQWTQVFSSLNMDSAYSVIQTTDGGYAIVGGYSYAPGPPDAWVIKTDSNGNQQWQRKVGGGSSEYGHCIQETSDGGYIVAGYTDSFGAGLEDARLFKLDSAGNILWIQNYGGNLDERANSVRQTSDGGFIMAGFSKSFGAGQADFYLIKTDNSGNLVWSHTFGGGSDEIANSVRQTTDGGYIICGTTASFGSGGTDIYMVKTDSSGSKEWDDTYGGTGNDDGQCVQQTSDGYYIIAGSKHIHTTYTQFWLIKLGISTNQAPTAPIVNGPRNGNVGRSYSYTFKSTDLDGDQISYYVEWGDASNTGWFGPYPSGAMQTKSHTWSTQGNYQIKAKAKDTNGAESGWASYYIIMPRARLVNIDFHDCLLKIADNHPVLFRILKYIDLR